MGGRDPECLSLKNLLGDTECQKLDQPAGHYPKGYCGCSLDIVVVCHQLFSVFGC